MRDIVVSAFVLGGLLATQRTSRADPLPAPRPVPVEVVPMPPVYYPYYPSVYTRRSAYDVWQFYAVDRQGQWRPRVVYEPGGGAYYFATGKPYPWVTTHERSFAPIIQGTPYRAYMPYARD